jgi:t-SNARE complex subunit (syntaxin)
MNEMGEMVGGEQRDMVNQIEDNLIEVRHNMQDTNEQMDQAIVYQKKSKKKYICVVATIVVILLIAFGLLYFLVINK